MRSFGHINQRPIFLLFFSVLKQSDQIQTLLSLAASVAPDAQKHVNSDQSRIRCNAMMIQATLVLAAFCLLDNKKSNDAGTDFTESDDSSDDENELLCSEELDSESDAEDSSSSLKLSPYSMPASTSDVPSSESSCQLNFSDLQTASDDEGQECDLEATPDHDQDFEEEESDLRARPQTESPVRGPARRLTFLFCD